MKLGCSIIYVTEVSAAVEFVEFYEKAFGLKCRLIHESRQSAEMETGAATRAFAAAKLIGENVGNFTKNEPHAVPANVKIAFTGDDVESDFAKVVNAGAKILKKPSSNRGIKRSFMCAA